MSIKNVNLDKVKTEANQSIARAKARAAHINAKAQVLKAKRMIARAS